MTNDNIHVKTIRFHVTVTNTCVPYHLQLLQFSQTTKSVNENLYTKQASEKKENARWQMD